MRDAFQSHCAKCSYSVFAIVSPLSVYFNNINNNNIIIVASYYYDVGMPEVRLSVGDVKRTSSHSNMCFSFCFSSLAFYTIGHFKTNNNNKID